MKLILTIVLFFIFYFPYINGEEEKDFRDVSNIEELQILLTKTETQYCCTVSLKFDKVFRDRYHRSAEVEILQVTPEKRTITTRFAVEPDDQKSPAVTLWFPTTDASKFSFRLSLYDGSAEWKTVKLSDLIKGKQIPSPFVF